MWQQHFGAPYEESTGESLAEQLKSEGTPTQEQRDMLRESLISYSVAFPRKKRSSVQPPPAGMQPRDHEKKAERGMALAFAGGLLAGLLLAKRV